MTGFFRATGLTDVLQRLGLTNNDSLLGSQFAVIGGLTYNFLPFMVLPIYAALETARPAADRGGRRPVRQRLHTFRKVIWPMSMPGVVSGTLLTFIPATGDYVNSELLGNTQTEMIGNVIDAQFLRVLDYPIAAALSFILMVAIVVLVFAYVRSPGRRSWCDGPAAPQPASVIAGLLVLAYLLLPNLVRHFAFSFNNPGQLQHRVAEFSPRRLARPVCERRHVRVARVQPAGRPWPPPVAATVLGTMVAFALVRYRFRGRAATNLLIFVPMATPEIVMGCLAAHPVRQARRRRPTGFVTIV